MEPLKHSQVSQAREKGGSQRSPRQLVGRALDRKAKDSASQPGICVGGRTQGASLQSPLISSKWLHPTLACVHAHMELGTGWPSTHDAEPQPEQALK